GKPLQEDAPIITRRDANGNLFRRRGEFFFCLPASGKKTPAHLPRFSSRYSFVSVRRITLPWASAGVAMHSSSSEFLPSTRNSGPASTTNVSPSSLRQKILPLYAHGDEVNSVALPSLCRS